MAATKKPKRKPATFLAWAVKREDGSLSRYSVWPSRQETEENGFISQVGCRVVPVRVTEVAS